MNEKSYKNQLFGLTKSKKLHNTLINQKPQNFLKMVSSHPGILSFSCGQQTVCVESCHECCKLIILIVNSRCVSLKFVIFLL